MVELELQTSWDCCQQTDKLLWTLWAVFSLMILLLLLIRLTDTVSTQRVLYKLYVDTLSHSWNTSCVDSRFKTGWDIRDQSNFEQFSVKCVNFFFSCLVTFCLVKFRFSSRKTVLHHLWVTPSCFLMSVIHFINW